MILAIANQKGGVGKTTTSINIAACLAAMHRRVLLVDLDPQGNATTGSGIDNAAVVSSTYDVLINGIVVADAKIAVDASGYDLLPANVDLSGAEVELMDIPSREHTLRNALESCNSSYDYIIIDCPPSLSLLTLTGLVAANGVIIPMQCEYYALEGLTALIGTISRITNRLNSELEIKGIVRTMFDPRNRLANEVSDDLVNHFGDLVFSTIIPRNVRLAEAPSYGLPIMYYDKQSRGARAHLALAGELVKRLESGD